MKYCLRWFLSWKSAPSCVACFKAAQYCATHCLWQGNYRICRLRDYHKQSVFAPRSVPSRRFTATRNIFSALSLQYAFAQYCFRWHPVWKVGSSLCSSILSTQGTCQLRNTSHITFFVQSTKLYTCCIKLFLHTIKKGHPE